MTIDIIVLIIVILIPPSAPVLLEVVERNLQPSWWSLFIQATGILRRKRASSIIKIITNIFVTFALISINLELELIISSRKEKCLPQQRKCSF